MHGGTAHKALELRSSYKPGGIYKFGWKFPTCALSVQVISALRLSWLLIQFWRWRLEFIVEVQLARSSCGFHPPILAVMCTFLLCLRQLYERFSKGG